MRYALYFAPARGTPLDVAGARWLGRDAWTGASVEPAVPEPIAPDRFAAVTAEPRRYGWHATLKPPFRLADGRTEADLLAAFRDFTASHSARPAQLSVARVGDFLALTPVDAALDLTRFAGACVTAFDGFRAPSPADDVARRRLAGLSPRQDELLLAWGYPYVFDEFRFHMTLTGRVFGAEAEHLQAAAEARFGGLLAEPTPIDTLALFVERAPGGPFTILEARALQGA